MEIPIAWKVNNVRFDFAGSYVFEKGQNRELRTLSMYIINGTKKRTTLQ